MLRVNWNNILPPRADDPALRRGRSAAGAVVGGEAASLCSLLKQINWDLDIDIDKNNYLRVSPCLMLFSGLPPVGLDFVLGLG